MTGIGVALVGHSNDAVLKAINEQAAKLITCHGTFYNDARAGFMERLAKIAPKSLTKALLANSGTESVEAAIKLARRHTARKKIVSMKGAFHGKTYGSLSATWNKKYRDPFGPLLDGFGFAEYGDPASLSLLVDNDTAAVLAEPVQGESGVIVLPPTTSSRSGKSATRKAPYSSSTRFRAASGGREGCGHLSTGASSPTS